MILDINDEDFIQCNKYFNETSVTVDIFPKAECNAEHILDVKLSKIQLYFQFHDHILAFAKRNATTGTFL